MMNTTHDFLNFNQVMLMDQIVCTGRQLRFKILRKFNNMIGMNITANKFYHINDEISFDMLNLKFVHYKKVCKLQYLKYGKT